MESEMENMMAEKKQMKLRISKQQDKFKACGQELKRKSQTVRDVNRIIKNVRMDIHCVSEHYQNPARLKDAVRVSVNFIY